MVTLEKLAGYQNEDILMDKVAEAMDYLAANGVDPLDGLTALVNIDGEGNVLDEKVASYIDELAEEQINALSQVGQSLSDEDPSEIAKVALDLQDEAEKIAAVAEAMDYLEANGIDPESAFIIAANVTPDGQFADEKVAYDVAEAGFNDYDFDKIAEAIEYLGENGVDLGDAIATAEILKEAAGGSGVIGAVGKKARAGWENVKEVAGKYWNTLKGTEANRLKESMKGFSDAGKKTESYKNLRKQYLQERGKQVAAIAGTGAAVGGAGYGAYRLHKRKK